MKQRRRTANNVMFCKEHTVADTFTVVEDGTVCKTCCFGLRRGATGKLDIHNW